MSATKDVLFIFLDDNDIDLLVHARVCSIKFPAAAVKTFQDPYKLIAFFEEHTHEYRSILMFVDIQMPGIDGFEFMDMYRELPESIKQTVQVFFLSSSRDPADVQKVEEMPEVLHFFNKPLQSELLTDVCPTAAELFVVRVAV